MFQCSVLRVTARKWNAMADAKRYLRVAVGIEWFSISDICIPGIKHLFTEVPYSNAVVLTYTNFRKFS